MKYFKLCITYEDSVGNLISKSYVELTSTNMMANDVIRAGTLGNNKFRIIHIFRLNKMFMAKTK